MGTAVALLLLLLVSTLTVDVGAASGSASTTAATSVAVAGGTWLAAVNDYRAMAGLAPVVEEAAWSDGLAKHLTYLQKTSTSLKSGAYGSAHTENPASAWYTPAGAEAGRSADLYLGAISSDRAAVDAWMAAPLHAVGILRNRLHRVAFARTEAGAALDVIRGESGRSSRQPVLWPGADSRVRLSEAGPESPDPLDSCPGFARPAGLPIVALLPSDPPMGTTARLRRPDGTTVGAGPDLCVITPSTFHSSDATYGPAGQSVLRSDHVVVIIPRTPLVTGPYRVELTRPGQITLTWSFTSVKDTSAAGRRSRR